MIRDQLPALPHGTFLGINYSGAHDSAIALVSPSGEPLFACALERVSRVKQDGRPPLALLDDMPWERIAAIGVSTSAAPWSPLTSESQIHPQRLVTPRSEVLAHAPPFLEFFDALPAPKRFYCHQMSHAHSAFWPSGFEDAMVLTYDGGMNNSPWFGGLYRASRANGIEVLDQFHAGEYAKITSLYSVVTGLLGFTPNKHEGKVTGLAAYGQPTDRCRRLLQDLFQYSYFGMEQSVEWLFAYSTEKSPLLIVNEEVRARILARFQGISREEMAATVQAMAEEHVIALLRAARAKGLLPYRRICLAGGLFANVKINQRVQEFGFDEIFVAPPMTDDGTAWGAALAMASEGSAFKPTRLKHVFLGHRFDDAQIQNQLRDFGLKAESAVSSGELAARVARQLANGEVVAVFQGGMEFGPRALGNRSILGQATRAEINQQLNDRLCRTEFMPFAPMTRIEDADRCYPALGGAKHAAEFMTVTCDCSDEMKRESPAVVHVDGTARPQLISSERHPFIHAVLTEYHRLTGHRSIFNTPLSFNDSPLVCTPEEAIQCFLEAGLDHLVFPDAAISVTFAHNLESAVKSMQSKRTPTKTGDFSDISQELWGRLEHARRAGADQALIVQSLLGATELPKKKFNHEDSSWWKTTSVALKKSFPYRVSIVVPTFNQGPYIYDCLASIQSQDIEDFEVIIQDSLSMDETERVCRSFSERDPRFKYFREKDRGQSDAINRGLEKATGQVWTWICSDDYYSGPYVIARATQQLFARKAQDSAVIGVFGRAQYVSETGKILGPYSEQKRDLKRDDFKLNWPLSQPSSFLLTDQVRRVGGVDAKLYLGMDLDLFLKLLRDDGKIIYCDEMVASVRVQSNSKSVKYRKSTALSALSIVKLHFGSVGNPFQSAYAWEYADTRMNQFLMFLKDGLARLNPLKKGSADQIVSLQDEAHVLMAPGRTAKGKREKIFVAFWSTYRFFKHFLFKPAQHILLFPVRLLFIQPYYFLLITRCYFVKPMNTGLRN